MKRFAGSLTTLIGALCMASPCVAEPAWGVNCLSCHGEWRIGALDLLGEDGVADPDESATGAPDRGPLPVYRVAPGQMRTLEVEIGGLSAGDVYAVEIKRLRFPGVVGAGELISAGDCNWAYWGEPGKYFTDPAVGYSWGSEPAALTFELEVSADAPEDYYDLVFAVAGKPASGGDLFYSEEHFYLQVTSTPTPGDFDGDGDVDIDDFGVFALCLARCPARIEPGCELADFDGDGNVDCLDWAQFGEAWTEPGDPPEVSSCALSAIPTASVWGVCALALMLAAAGTTLLRRRPAAGEESGAAVSVEGKACE